MKTRTKRIDPIFFVAAFVFVATLAVSFLYLSRGSGVAPRFQGAIPPTPTASIASIERVSPADSKPAFDILRESQVAMQKVYTYHFELDNSTDSYTIAGNDAADVVGVAEQKDPLLFLGDVSPPTARYSGRKAAEYNGRLIVGSERYALIESLLPGNPYHKITIPADEWYILDGALHNPQQFLNDTLDTALCGSVLTEEKYISGAYTIHLRFVLPHDEISVRDTTLRYIYVRDIWVDKDSHYLRRIQVREIFNTGKPCVDGMEYEFHEEDNRFTTGILTFSKHNVPISPPIY